MKLVILIAAVLAIVVLGAYVKGKPGGQVLGKYKRRKLMTENELEFFGRLVKALPGHYIFPQVSMGALLEASSSDTKQAHSDRLRIAQQRVDYLVCDERCAIVAVVELDDKTHSRTKDQLRDARLEQAGIRTVRFQSRNKPSMDDIRYVVLPHTPLGQAQGGQHGSVTVAGAGAGAGEQPSAAASSTAAQPR
jgi:hypothetical protein